MLRSLLDGAEQAQCSGRTHSSGARPGCQVAPTLLDPRNGPEFDLSNVGPPRRAYVILSSPRTASTLLCRSLWDTGLVGAPKEYCNPMQLRDWSVRFSGSTAYRTAIGAIPGRLLVGWERSRGPRTRRVHLARVLQHRTSADGIFGLKLQPDQLRRWFGDVPALERLLGPVDVVRLHRRDRVAQVDSFVHALQTGQWSATDRPSRIRLPVSRRWAKHEIDRQERQLDALTAGRTAHRLTTEALISQFDASVRGVLQFLGVSYDGTLPGPSQQRQTR